MQGTGKAYLEGGTGVGETLLVWEPCTGYTPFSRRNSGFHSPWVKTPISNDRGDVPGWITLQSAAWLSAGARCPSTEREKLLSRTCSESTSLPEVMPALNFLERPSTLFWERPIYPRQHLRLQAPPWWSETQDGCCHRARVTTAPPGQGRAAVTLGAGDTYGLGHCQSPARCWTLPPEGFPRDPRGPREEKPPRSPPLPPIRPMGPLGPLGPPGPPGPPGPVRKAL